MISNAILLAYYSFYSSVGKLFETMSSSYLFEACSSVLGFWKMIKATYFAKINFFCM